MVAGTTDDNDDSCDAMFGTLYTVPPAKGLPVKDVMTRLSGPPVPNESTSMKLCSVNGGSHSRQRDATYASHHWLF